MKSRGMTLVELLVTMIIGGVMAYVVGMIIVSSFTESLRAVQQSSLQNDVRYFERLLAKQFRSALSDDPGPPPTINVKIPPSHQTIQFASYIDDDALTLNQYVQYTYSVNPGRVLQCNIQQGSRDLTGKLKFTPPGTTVNVINNIDSISFSFNTQKNAVTTELVQLQRLAGGKVHKKTISFDVLSRNR